MTLRVIQWASGGVGRAAMEGVLGHPDLDLAGCWVHSAGKHGVDLGTLLGRDPIGLAASNDVDALLATGADAVIYAPIFADPRVVDRILASGKDVVTPLGWFFPEPAERDRIDAVARAAGTTLHGTGIHPGGITERFPLVLSALSGSITHVRAEEFSDIRTYGAPDVIRHVMAFGGTPDEALASPMAALLGGGFKASVRMVADELGFRADPKIRTTQQVAVATASIDSPIGTIEPGLVAARRFDWQATVDDVPVVTATVNWLMGEEHLDPAWGFGPEGERFEVEVTGDPSVLLTFKGLQPESVAAGLVRNPGVVSTANHCVSAIPYVVAAEPGIRTYLDLPLIAGRAAPDLGRQR